MILYGHPFAAYYQKAATAFREKGVDYTLAQLGPDHPAEEARWAELWPMRKMPVLEDGDRAIWEATSVIEYLELRHPAPRLIPADPEAALEVRWMDRIFDNYVMAPQQRIVFDAIRPEGDRDPTGVGQARDMLERIYDWLEGRMAGRVWAAGDFSLADCAAAPSLFYADWTQPIGERPALAAYRARLLARPSFASLVNEARPYRHFFPLGAPDRD